MEKSVTRLGYDSHCKKGPSVTLEMGSGNLCLISPCMITLNLVTDRHSLVTAEKRTINVPI